MEWLERKGIWFALPVTAWLAWSYLFTPVRVRDDVKTSFIPSQKLRLPLREWKSFEAEDQSFSVRMPGTPQVMTSQQAGEGPTKTWSVLCNRGIDGDLGFHVSSFAIADPRQLSKFQGTLHWFTCLQAQDFPDMQRCVVRPIRKSTVDGGEFFIETADSQVMRYAVRDGDTVYYATCVGSNLDAYQEDCRQFLDSFEINRSRKSPPSPPLSLPK